MRFPSLLFGLTSALTVSAFLIPFESTSKSILDAEPKRQSIQVPCADCNFKKTTLDSVVPNSPHDEIIVPDLGFDFEVRDGQVLMNDKAIYPFNPRSGGDLVAKLEWNESNHGILPLSTEISVQPNEVFDEQPGAMTLHSMTIDILGVGTRVLHVDTIRVRFIELASGEIALLPVETTPYAHHPLKDSCTNVFCRVRFAIAAKMAAFRAAVASRMGSFRTGCGGKATSNTLRLKGGPNKFAGHRRPHHRHHSGLRMAMRRVVRNILLPIFFGITAGLVVGAFSMLFWTAVVSLLHRARGTKPPAYESVAQAEDGDAGVEAPPKYEQAYEEPEYDVVDEKKPLM